MRNLAKLRVNSQNVEFLHEIHGFFSNSQNVAVYGYGSKLQLLRDYAENLLRNDPVLIFYGFYATISSKMILSALEKTVNCLKSKGKHGKSEANGNKSASERLKTLENELSALKNTEKIVVIVHNIDGKALSDGKTQELLSEIAKMAKVLQKSGVF